MNTRNDEKRLQEDIQEALDDLLENKEHKVWKRVPEKPTLNSILEVLTYVILLLGLLLLHFAFHLDQLPIEEKYLPAVPKIIIGLTLVIIVFLVTGLIRIYFISKIANEIKQYNLNRSLRIIRIISVSFITFSVIYTDWYTVLTSLGIISVVVGFALQTPILSLIGWLYIVFRKPYKIGDTIKVGDNFGVVIDIDYLDTTIWEIKGDYLSVDHPTGRIIRFPNANLLNASVFNYSWALFPFMYDEISFYVAFDSDIKHIKHTVKAIVDHEMDARYTTDVNYYKTLLKKVMINTEHMIEKSDVIFKPADNMWLQVIVLYAVNPAESGILKKELTHQILDALNLNGNAIFPPGNNR